MTQQKNAAKQTGNAGEVKVVKHVDYGMQVFVRHVERLVKRNEASKKFCKK
jgi:hypothetical protein